MAHGVYINTVSTIMKQIPGSYRLHWQATQDRTQTSQSTSMCMYIVV